MVTKSAKKVADGRVYYLDWLRIAAMISIFLFHSNRIFDNDSWHINNAQTSLVSTTFVEVFNLWMMPLFFVLSGAAVFYSLKRRTGREFIKERILRIALPWIILGMFVISPPQVYVERLTMDGFTGNFFQFIPHYFDGLYAFGGNFAWMGLHLWYLMVLFVFSLITLPLLLPGKKIGISLVSRLAVRLNNLGGLLLLFLPLAAAPFIANMVGLDITRQMGSWDILSYLIFFIIGFMISSSNGLQETIKRYAYHILIFAFIITLVGFLLDEMHYLIEMSGRSLISFSWVLGLIGTGARLLNFKNKFSDYAIEAVLPFYILHQLVIVVIGYFVVQWNVGIGLKYLVVVSSSFIVIVALYDLLVRRLPWLRFLFGMRRINKRNGITT